MRNSPLRAFAKKSPIYKDFDFSKKADYLNVHSRVDRLLPNVGIKGEV